MWQLKGPLLIMTVYRRWLYLHMKTLRTPGPQAARLKTSPP
jgi:hypothetical protein